MKIVAYGSLMNQNSLEKTLQRSAQLITVTVPNVQRVFNAPFGDYAFLNLAFVEDNSIEAAYFELDKEEIEKFNQRERGSELVEVMAGMYAFVWPKAYCKDLPVLQSYIDFCQTGCRELNINFWPGTQQPQVIFDDAKKPLYP